MPTKRKARPSTSRARRASAPARSSVVTAQYFETRGFSGGTPEQRLRAALEFIELAQRAAPGKRFPVINVNVPATVYVDLSAWPEGKMFGREIMRFLRGLHMVD